MCCWVQVSGTLLLPLFPTKVVLVILTIMLMGATLLAAQKVPLDVFLRLNNLIFNLNRLGWACASCVILSYLFQNRIGPTRAANTPPLGMVFLAQFPALNLCQPCVSDDLIVTCRPAAPPGGTTVQGPA